MIFSSKYSKMSFSDRVNLFRNLTSGDVRKYLKKNDLRKYHPDDRGQNTPLNIAVRVSDINVVLELVKMGANAFSETNRFANPPICDAIASGRPVSDIRLISKFSKFVVDWNIESIGAFSCQIAAARRTDKRMLEFLHAEGVDLKKIHSSDLDKNFSAFSEAIELGALESVEFLHSLGCEYPHKMRGGFRRIFYSKMPQWKQQPHLKKEDENDLADLLKSDRWTKIKYLIDSAIIEPYFLRKYMEEWVTDAELKKGFWLSIDKTVAEYKIRTLFTDDILDELSETHGVSVVVSEELRDKRTGQLYGKVLSVREQWLIDLHNLNTEN